MKKKGKADKSKKPKPLDSGQWISESTLTSNAAPANQSRSQSASQSHAPPPVTPALRIYRDGVDVTGKTTKAFSGQTVTLTAVVKPKKFGGSNWEWTAPADLVKNFKVKTIARKDKEGTRENYVHSDFKKQAISLHWVDGGGKTVFATATIKGIEYSASTTIDVTRPTVDLVPTQQGPQIDPVVNGVYVAFAQMDFEAKNLSHPGSLYWVQVGVYLNEVIDLQGHIIEKRSLSGLDGCKYPNARISKTQDQPSFGFLTNKYQTFAQTFEATMYLLWKSPKPGLYVPLRSMAWRFNGILENAGAAAPPVWKTVTPPPTPDKMP